MNKVFTFLVAVFLTANVFAQSPEKMSYQAVIRNSSDALVTNTQVGMRISILQGSASGTAVYVETQTLTSNANGLVSLEIGIGTTSDDFSSIDWANGPYFIKTETDPTGGTSYTITGTRQLLSVPYALHAKTAENGITTQQASDITANNAKVGYTDALVSANADVVANTAKVGITTAQSDAISANTAKTGITAQQASDITANNAKVGITTAQADAITANTLKVGITTTQANAILANTAKISAATGTAAGQMQYWNGSAWVVVAATINEGAALQMIGGVPTWTGGTPPTPSSVTSPTGKIWMDRNLGASQVATSSTDAASYGDLYQWGRGTDGHQIRTSGTTATLSTTDAPGHGNFITINTGNYDWRSPQNGNLWQGVSGTNNPCPSGYRLPTEAEWEAERASWSSSNSVGAFGSPLKLPVAGGRNNSTGSLYVVGSFGIYWSSTVDGAFSRFLNLTSSGAGMGNNYRALGFSVRCLKD